MQASSIELRNILKELNYPLKKKDLIQEAQKHGATSAIIEVLNNIPDKEYTTASHVTNECNGRFRSWR